MKMRIVKVEDERNLIYDQAQSGRFCAVGFEDIAQKITGRESGVTLKLFFQEKVRREWYSEEIVWGIMIPRVNEGEPEYSLAEWSTLRDATFAQNICAEYGLAPKVHEIVMIDYRGWLYPAQVVEKLEGKLEMNTLDFMKKVQEVGEQWGFVFKLYDMNPNLIDGKLIDFQNVEVDWKKAKKVILNNYSQKCQWAGQQYQPSGTTDPAVPIRQDSVTRLRNCVGILNTLFKSDWLDKPVWDVGCSGGNVASVLRKYAHHTGRIANIDMPEVLEGAKPLATMNEVFNLDWYPRTFEREDAIHGIDFHPYVTFFLSMQRHVGILKGLGLAPILVYEHNGDEPEAEMVQKIMTECHYNRKRLVGRFSVHDNRGTWILWNEQRI